MSRFNIFLALSFICLVSAGPLGNSNSDESSRLSESLTKQLSAPSSTFTDSTFSSLTVSRPTSSDDKSSSATESLSKQTLTPTLYPSQILSNSTNNSSNASQNLSENATTPYATKNATSALPYYPNGSTIANTTHIDPDPVASCNKSSIGNLTGSAGCPTNESFHEKVKLRKKMNLKYDNPAGANVRVDIPKMRYPSTNLEPADDMPVFRCALNESSLISFKSLDILDTAINDWKSNLVRSPSGFMIITSVPCDNVTSLVGEKSFLLVKNFTVEKPTKSVRFAAKKLSFEEAVDPHAVIGVDVDDWNVEGDNGFTVDGKDLAVPDSDADFDQVLDKSTGYLDPQNSGYWQQLLPGVSSTAAEQYFRSNGTSSERIPLDSGVQARSINGEVFPHHLQARGWFSNLFKKIRNAIASVVNTIAKGVALIVGDRTFTPFSTSLAFDNYLGSSDSPWEERKAILIKKNKVVDVYCVDCGGSGKIKAKAQIRFSVSDGIKEASVATSGSLKLSLGLGLVLQESFDFSYSKQLFAVPLSPLTIPGVVTIGPEFSVDAGAAFGTSGLGKFVAGVAVSWTAFDATLSFKGESHANGLQPTLDPFLEGQIGLHATIFGKLSLSFGLSILNGMFKRSLSLSGRQGLSAKTVLGASKDCGLEGILNTTSTIKVEVFGMKEYTLFEHEQPLLKHCLIRNFDDSNSTGNTTTRGLACCQIDAGKLEKIHKLSKRKSDGNESLELGPMRTNQRITSLVQPGNPEVSQAKIFAPELNANLVHTQNGNIYVTSSLENTIPGNSTFENSTSALVNSTSASGNSTFGNFDSFAVIDGVVVGDSNKRLLHAYVSTLSTMGISRLRLSNPDRLPMDSVIINLYDVPTDNSTVSNALIAATSDGTPYYPVICSFENQPARAFLISDAETGIAKLKSPDSAQSVTGGAVTECGFFFLQIVS